MSQIPFDSCFLCRGRQCQSPIPRRLGKSNRLLIAQLVHGSRPGHGAYRLSYKDKDDHGGVGDIVAHYKELYDAYDQASVVGCQFYAHSPDLIWAMTKCMREQFLPLSRMYEKVVIIDRDDRNRTDSFRSLLVELNMPHTVVRFEDKKLLTATLTVAVSGNITYIGFKPEEKRLNKVFEIVKMVEGLDAIRHPKT